MNVMPALLLILAALPPSTFELLDVESVAGRPVNRYRLLEFSREPVRPIRWEVPPPPEVRYGLVPVGTDVESSLAVAWDSEAPAIWLDSDGDGQLKRSERHELRSGDSLAVTASITMAAGPKTSLVTV